MTAPQFGVLALLQATPGRSNAELARQSLITPQTMNVILSRLETAGLVLRTAHPGHARILLTDLTPLGQATLNRCLDRATAVEARVLEALDTSERPKLLDNLARIADALAAVSRW